MEARDETTDRGHPAPLPLESQSVETLRHILLEDPTWLYVGLSILLLVQLVFWRKSRSRRGLVALAVPIVLAVAVFAVSSLVQTDRERIAEKIERIVEAVNAGQLEQIPAHFDEQFETELRWGRTPNELIAAGRRRLKSARVEEVQVTRLEIDVAGSFADATVSLLLRTAGGTFPTTLQVRWVKIDDTWKIRGIQSADRGR
jgi:hypothetical protein